MCIRRQLLLAVFLLVCSLGTGAQDKEIKRAPVRPTSAASGKEMFASYCAVCHGRDGKGGGPAATALKVPPADLTVLSQKNGGKFPSNHVASVLGGEADLSAHGNKEMPVWGPVFRGVSHGNAGEVQQRIANLTKFIESLQAK
jgi:mono/diheme cytochrome c family protein